MAICFKSLVQVTAFIICLILAGCSPCKKFIKYQGFTLTIESLSASLPDSTKASTGRISFDTQKYREASEKLQELDLYQFQICQTLNNMQPGPRRDEYEAKWLETLMEMSRISANPDSAIRMLHNEVQSLEKRVQHISTQGEFRPLSYSARDSIVSSLKNCHQCKDMTYEIYNASGQTVNDQISQEITSILQASNLKASKTSGHFFYSHDRNDEVFPYAVMLSDPNKSQQIAEEFVHAIRPLFSNFTPAPVLPFDRLRSNQLRLVIWGNPRFDDQGRIDFK